MLFCGGCALPVEKMVAFHKAQAGLSVADEAQQNKDYQGQDRQGYKLRYPGNHKGQLAAEEHIITR